MGYKRGGIGMRKYGNNNYSGSIKYVVFLLCLSSAMHAYRSCTSFEAIFPRTWYQKGLESSLFIWQLLSTVFEKNQETERLCEIILARLAFTQFCINRMQYVEVEYLSEDISYFEMVLNKVKVLVEDIAITDENEDFVLCIQEMITILQKQVSIL